MEATGLEKFNLFEQILSNDPLGMKELLILIDTIKLTEKTEIEICRPLFNLSKPEWYTEKHFKESFKLCGYEVTAEQLNNEVYIEHYLRVRLPKSSYTFYKHARPKNNMIVIILKEGGRVRIYPGSELGKKLCITVDLLKDRPNYYEEMIATSDQNKNTWKILRSEYKYFHEFVLDGGLKFFVGGENLPDKAENLISYKIASFILQ